MRTSRKLAFLAITACVASSLAHAQAPSQTSPSPVDDAFIGQTYLGNQFQVDTGRLGENQAKDPAVRDYAKLMDTTHVEVENKLAAILRRKGLTQPPTSLLAGAYGTLTRHLGTEHGAAFDRDYVAGQVDYQKANDLLYRWEIQNGSDDDLKAFARDTLPKIDDHLQRATKLEGASRPAG